MLSARAALRVTAATAAAGRVTRCGGSGGSVGSGSGGGGGGGGVHGHSIGCGTTAAATAMTTRAAPPALAFAVAPPPLLGRLRVCGGRCRQSPLGRVPPTAAAVVGGGGGPAAWRPAASGAAAGAAPPPPPPTPPLSSTAGADSSASASGTAVTAVPHPPAIQAKRDAFDGDGGVCGCTSREEYVALVEELLAADAAYYRDNPAPLLTDEAYDALLAYVAEVEATKPDWVDPRSPVGRVSHAAATAATVKAAADVTASAATDAAQVTTEGDLTSAATVSAAAAYAAEAAAKATASMAEATEAASAASVETACGAALVPSRSAGAAFFSPAAHVVPMLSLTNTYAAAEVHAWATRVAPRVLSGEGAPALVADLKVDGVALSLRYVDGVLASAATRGNGRVGDNVTANVRAALVAPGAVPARLPTEAAAGVAARVAAAVAAAADGTTAGASPSVVIDIRGEVYMERAALAALNAGPGPRLANARNAAAGALKLHDPAAAATRPLSFVPYAAVAYPAAALAAAEAAAGETGSGGGGDGGDGNGGGELVTVPITDTHTTLLQWLAVAGFTSMPRWRRCADTTEAVAFAADVAAEREDLPLDVDGVVVRLDDAAAAVAAGATARSPRGAVALKFAAAMGVTRLAGVEHQVSRAGVLTPVAVLYPPLSLGGVSVSRATLHNYDHAGAGRLGAVIGALVTVARGGDVIPKIVAVHARPAGGAAAARHAADAATPRRGAVVAVARCTNARGCAAQVIGRLTHYGCPSCMDIRGLGSATARRLVDARLVTTPADLHALTAAAITEAGIPGMGPKAAANLVAAAAGARSARPLAAVIHALGPPGVGAVTAQVLARRAGSLAAVVPVLGAPDVAPLADLPGIGGPTAAAIGAFFRHPSVVAEVDRLLAAGVAGADEAVLAASASAALEATAPTASGGTAEEDVDAEPAAEVAAVAAASSSPAPAAVAASEAAATAVAPLAGVSVVFTGGLTGRSRSVVAAAVTAAGGSVRSSLTSRTGVLVTGDLRPAAAKLRRAAELGVTVVGEKQLDALLVGGLAALSVEEGGGEEADTESVKQPPPHDVDDPLP
ncbi:hypothetical protein MMPV_006551 [Pyropia vietnamensis]